MTERGQSAFTRATFLQITSVSVTLAKTCRVVRLFLGKKRLTRLSIPPVTQGTYNNTTWQILITNIGTLHVYFRESVAISYAESGFISYAESGFISSPI